MSDGHGIILFDGHCVLCSANARFVLRHDRRRHFRLAAAQSEAGLALQARHGLNRDALETIAVVEDGRALTQSDAVIAIAAGLGWPWRAAAAARLVPHFVRDPLYRWVARNRYRWFGRREACWRPDPADADRML
jgi:predicted DCC family thiol-disulfide oxidoreductase YuxK